MASSATEATRGVTRMPDADPRRGHVEHRRPREQVLDQIRADDGEGEEAHDDARDARPASRRWASATGGLAAGRTRTGRSPPPGRAAWPRAWRCRPPGTCRPRSSGCRTVRAAGYHPLANSCEQIDLGQEADGRPAPATGRSAALMTMDRTAQPRNTPRTMRLAATPPRRPRRSASEVAGGLAMSTLSAMVRSGARGSRSRSATGSPS